MENSNNRNAMEKINDVMKHLFTAMYIVQAIVPLQQEGKKSQRLFIKQSKIGHMWICA